MKDKLLLHLQRCIEEEEVSDSATFSKFGKKYMEQPGPKSGIERRTFYDLKKETIKERTDEVSK